MPFPKKQQRRRILLRRRVFIRTIACVFQYRYYRQFSLQGDANPNGSDANANTNASRTNAYAYRWSNPSSAARGWLWCALSALRSGLSGRARRRSRGNLIIRSGSRLSGWGRFRNWGNLFIRSGSGLSGWRRRRSKTTVAAITTSRHCRAAKRNAQANNNHCYNKLLHKVCLLYW